MLPEAVRFAILGSVASNDLLMPAHKGTYGDKGF